MEPDEPGKRPLPPPPVEDSPVATPAEAPTATPPASSEPVSRPPKPKSVARMAVGFYGVVVLFSFGYALFSGTASTLFGEHAPTGSHLLTGVGIGAAIVLLCRLADWWWPAVRRAEGALAEILGPVGFGTGILLALVSGFAEELLFRGALWTHLGLVGSSLLFGVVHFLPRRALLLYPVFAAAAGLAFGLLRSGTSNVVPCMVAHAVVNGVNLAWIEGRRRKAARS